MRVTCGTIDEFIENLKALPHGAVFQKVIYVSRTRNSIDGTARNGVRFSVVLQASAVVDLGDDGQYLLEAGEDCGIDYEDSTQERKGTERASELRQKIKRHCESHGIDVRPGIVDM